MLIASLGPCPIPVREKAALCITAHLGGQCLSWVKGFRDEASRGTAGLPSTAEGRCLAPVTGSKTPTTGPTRAAGGTEGSCQKETCLGKSPPANPIDGRDPRGRQFSQAECAEVTVIQFTAAVINVLYMFRALRQNGGLLCRAKNLRKNISARFLRLRQAAF